MERAIRLSAILARRCLVLLLAVWQLQALAQTEPPALEQIDQRDHISARAWLDDPSNNLGPDQVRAMAWVPYVGPLRLGYKASTTWLRLTIQPLADEGRGGEGMQARLVLRIQPGHLDEIALFDPRHPELPPLFAGDRHDWRLSEYRSFNQNLVISAPNEPIEILLRLRTNSHHGIHVEALKRVDVEAQDRQQQLIIGGLIMFLCVVLVWAVNAWYEYPERVIAAFIVHQIVSILFAMSLLGFSRVYLSSWLSAHFIDLLTSAMFAITTIAVIWFHSHFLREFKPPELGMHFIKVLLVITSLTLILMVSGRMRLALQTLAVISIAYPLLLLFLSGLTVHASPGETPRLARRHLVLLYGVMFAVLCSATLPALGLMPSPPWAMYSAIVYGLISAALLFIALRFRALKGASIRQRTLSELALAEQGADLERKRRIEQDQFMTMLSHELTNALATAHLAIGSLSPSAPMRARGYRAIESMRDIIRRCSLSGEFEANDSKPQLAAVDVLPLLHELCDQLPADANIQLNSEPRLPVCTTDRKLLSLILGNLLDNALKYRASASVIEVSARAQIRGSLAGLHFRVSNAAGAAGIPDADHVFKKYWRGPAATHCAGSGLGLYLCLLIADRLGGELLYQPEDSNVRFELWLPL
jgi:signal transduction histidine kinase